MSKRKDTIGILMVLISVLGTFAKSNIMHFDNTFLNWTVMYSIIVLSIIYAFRHSLFVAKPLIPCSVFLLWALYGILAGVVFVDNYWIAKQWLFGITCVSLPCVTYIFYDPLKTLSIQRTWNRWIFPLFLCLLAWIIKKGAFHFCFGPIYFLYGIFFCWLPKRWKWFIVFFLVLMLTGDVHARAQVIKGFLCLIFAIAIYKEKHIPKFLVQIIPWFFFIIAGVLLYLGLSGTYNIFDHEKKKGLSYEMIFSEGNFYGDEKIIGEQATSDTRTFIYIEVIESALKNDYVILGRTLARGNDSESFGEESLTGIQERYANELCHLNIFTWLGIIGLLLYTAIYIVATWLAAFNSNNIYISYLGIMVAFHWAFGWIEDMNNFDSMNIGLWMVIAMCLSPKFRKMTNKEFALWFKSIFSEHFIPPYFVYKLLKIKISNSYMQIRK